ncbi:hypothetical protein H4219_001359 [Mycoemilia scoparia]|uniref:Uncharacterized protein n=1 Tax=Mycoemilia scoparia TaxID=417184 RepID=A0A9W8A9Q8_9FUNG|nr:hypothetical protein H4219_001359 [Mycoemilia scoparia]
METPYSKEQRKVHNSSQSHHHQKQHHGNLGHHNNLHRTAISQSQVNGRYSAAPHHQRKVTFEIGEAKHTNPGHKKSHQISSHHGNVPVNYRTQPYSNAYPMPYYYVVPGNQQVYGQSQYTGHVPINGRNGDMLGHGNPARGFRHKATIFTENNTGSGIPPIANPIGVSKKVAGNKGCVKNKCTKTIKHTKHRHTHHNHHEGTSHPTSNRRDSGKEEDSKQQSAAEQADKEDKPPADVVAAAAAAPPPAKKSSPWADVVDLIISLFSTEAFMKVIARADAPKGKNFVESMIKKLLLMGAGRAIFSKLLGRGENGDDGGSSSLDFGNLLGRLIGGGSSNSRNSLYDDSEKMVARGGNGFDTESRTQSDDDSDGGTDTESGEKSTTMTEGQRSGGLGRALQIISVFSKARKVVGNSSRASSRNTGLLLLMGVLIVILYIKSRKKSKKGIYIKPT